MAALQLNHQFQFLKFGPNVLHCSISRGEIRDGREPDQEIPSSWRLGLCADGWSNADGDFQGKMAPFPTIVYMKENVSAKDVNVAGCKVTWTN